MNPPEIELMKRAKRSYKSASILFKDGDYNGSVNRAYYAMHDAAKAALIREKVDGAEKIKTHSGLISAFSKNLVQNKKVKSDLGRFLSLVESRRIVADYSYAAIGKKEAEEVLSLAKTFISGIEVAIILNNER